MADLTPEQIHELNSVVAGAGGETTPGQVPKIDVVTQGNILRAQTERQVAREKLDGLIADPAWGKKLTAKDPATVDEFARLTATIASDNPPVTLEGLAAGTRSRQFNAAADAFAANAGLAPAIAEQIKADTPVTETEMRAAENWMARHTADQDWVSKLFKGDVDAVREFATCNVVLASRVIPDAKRAS
jgi:hypothetical protein